MRRKVRRSRKVVVGQSGVIAGVRKLVRYGNNVHVSVPREWLAKHGLEEGDEVVIAADSVLRIIPLKEVS